MNNMIFLLRAICTIQHSKNSMYLYFIGKHLKYWFIFLSNSTAQLYSRFGLFLWNVFKVSFVGIKNIFLYGIINFSYSTNFLFNCTFCNKSKPLGLRSTQNGIQLCTKLFKLIVKNFFCLVQYHNLHKTTQWRWRSCRYWFLPIVNETEA